MNRDSEEKKTKQLVGTETFLSPRYYISPYPTNPYEPANPYTAPKNKQRKRLIAVLVSLICLVVAITSVLFAVLITTLHNQNISVTSKPPLTPTLASTTLSTPTPHPGTLSRTPLLEKDNQSNWLCYVTITDEPGTFAVLSNPNSSTVYGDCVNFMGQGNYYSTTPIHAVAGDTLQCEGWATDNTFWKVEAIFNDLNTITMCGDLQKAVPGTQG